MSIVSLERALDKMIKHFGIERPVQQYQALNIWEDIVGKKIAKHTAAEKIAYGKLYVKVDSPLWRQELSLRREEILIRINKKLDKIKIKEIILR